MRNPLKPRPAPPAYGEGRVVPERHASLLSRLLFYWLDPLLKVGFSRPLEKDDLWSLPDEKLTTILAEHTERAFFTRHSPDERPSLLRTTDSNPSKSDESPPFTLNESTSNIDSPTDKTSKQNPSLTLTLFRTFRTSFVLGGLGFFIASMLQTTVPLVTRELLSWLSKTYEWHRLGDEARAQAKAAGDAAPRDVGYGLGLAFALFAMQEASSLFMNQGLQALMTTGLYVRTAVIGTIFRKSLRLSGRARLEHSVGQITTMISTDATRLDRAAWHFNGLWTSPVQIAVGIGLLVRNLGYSALVGLAILVLGLPLQFALVVVIFRQRRKGVDITDKRVRLTNEVLLGVRLIKYYGWETFYASRISDLRTQEVSTIRRVALARSLLIALLTFLPVLATILTFVTYSLTGHTLNAATVFSSLQLFNSIRFPLMIFPIVFSSVSDAVVALQRIGKFLNAEEGGESYAIEREVDDGVRVDADFVWEAAGKSDEGKPSDKTKKDKDDEKRSKRKGRNEKDASVLPTTAPSDNEKQPLIEAVAPFALKNVRLTIPRGAFVAVVGKIGAGKSSLLKGLTGEMRKTRGEVMFGGPVAYVPQSAWIMNATVRENIIFGREDDDEKFQKIVQACSLSRDLEMLPNGELTEIGERGINLSGGQKARVSIARAAYSDADVVLLDDCLSAVDAHTGKALMQECLLSGPLSGKTRVLVTHALHVLDKVDYIYVMDEGRIVEEGTFANLRDSAPIFSKLMDDYGALEQADEIQSESKKGGGGASDSAEGTEKKPQEALMQEEERSTGAVTWDTYRKYLKNAGSVAWAFLILALLILGQCATVANQLFLGFWTSQSISGFTQGQYMAVYAALGVAEAIATFFVSLVISWVALAAGLRLFKAALHGVLHSSTAFFDTTPMGRIISRLSKDQDTIDQELSMTLFNLLVDSMSIFGTIGLIFYSFPYLGIMLPPLVICYWTAAMYYRRTSVESKRLDSLMRSGLYASYNETLNGISTVRAFNEEERFLKAADRALDMENRAYYMTISLQRWLSIRLDFFGNILILAVSLFAVGERNNTNPAKVGVVLSYLLAMTQWFSEMVAGYALNEQNMNAVERILVYTELEPEGAEYTPNDPPSSWPSMGAIEFKDVELAYRKGLPLVLKGVSFQVKPGEKVGIVGRTGAGKSSLMQALFRMVEMQSGSICIDGVNIRDIGLATLRNRLALVPQDSTLFLGTLRENLDPQKALTDAELISALQRSWLLPREGSDDAADAKFGLDAMISDEGSNYSAGEKQLLALCRALVKNSRIIILDEATSNVDVETDAKLQKTIQTEFGGSTLLCIAHRLNTIAYYDRILVMDAGRVAEFDTPLKLFDQEESIFRSLCDEAGLSRQDIVRIRATVEHTTPRGIS